LVYLRLSPQDNVPALVVDRVWVGSIHAAFNQEALHDRGITHVLNASGLPATFPRSFTYFGVDLRDKEEVNILGAIGAANIFIDAGVEKGGVLVHCAGGRSRSAAFVVAYIMSTLGYTYDQAYDVLKAARPVVSINRGFEMQLRAYGATGCDLHASHQMMLRARVRGSRSADGAGLL
jgi:dual specificity phosphatase 12